MSCMVFCMVSALFVIVGDVVVVTRKHDSNAFEPFYSFIIVYLYSKIMSRILFSHIYRALIRPNRCMKLLYFYLSISRWTLSRVFGQLLCESRNSFGRLGFWLYWNLLLYSLTYSHLISTHHIHIHSLSHLSIVLLWCSVRFFGGYNSANKNKSNFHHQLNFHPSHKLLLLISLFPNLARFLFGFRFCPLAIYFFFISCSSISLVSNWRVRFCRSFVFFFFFKFVFVHCLMLTNHII